MLPVVAKAGLVTAAGPKLRVSGGGGGGSVAHGDQYVVSGSGYGTRTVLADIWDDTTGAAITSKWNALTGNRIAYSTPAAFLAGSPIDLPHSNITQFIGIKHRQGTYYDYNNWLAHTVTVVRPYNVYIHAYRRTNPNWIFGTGDSANSADNNYKNVNIATGSEPFSGNYWYHDHTGQKSTLTGSWGESFHASGSLGSFTIQTATTGGSGDQANDQWYSWVKHEYRIVGDATAGVIRYHVNNTQKYNETGVNTDNVADGNRIVCIGHYGRAKLDNTTDIDANSGREMALADVAMVIGADAFKRVMFTNNATYSSSTIVEYQPVVSWNGTVTVQVNKGKLSAGTAHVHMFDSSDSSSYIGTVSLS